MAAGRWNFEVKELTGRRFLSWVAAGSEEGVVGGVDEERGNPDARKKLP